LAQGFNVIIVGRSSDKLETVRAALNTEFPKQTVETVCSEASDVSDANIQSIVDKLEHFPVTVLVNNVGMGQGNKLGLDNIEPDLIRKLINVNCTFPTLLTRAVLQSLTKRRERTLVINVASVAGLVVNPFHGLYGASKAFNHSLSLSMSMEYPNIDVLSVCPGT
jgi:short-subunit dehydrogenase